MSLRAFSKRNVMPIVSALFALATVFIVPPSHAYLAYFDWHTLACLFAVLAVLCALRSIDLFRILAQRFVVRFKTTRTVITALVLITFVGSMFLTNDMALLIFLPLTAVVLSSCHQERRLLFAFVMQTLAANLGGMILPFGNPQNLYLFSYYNISLTSFLATLIAPFLLSLGLIICCCLCIRSEPLRPVGYEAPPLSLWRTILYLILFALAIAMVFGLLPYAIGAGMILIVLLIFEPRALLRVDYALLFTFVCIFVFSGNLARVPVIQELLADLLRYGAFPVSVLCSQFISNVPAAILLSHFTQDWQALLLGVNVGGLGTVVASLASLIALREYQRCLPGQTLRFLLVFTLFNLLFLGVLVAFCMLVL